MRKEHPGPFRVFIAGACALVALCTTPAVASDLGVHLGYAKGADAEDGNGFLGGHGELSLFPFLGVQGAVDYRLAETSHIIVGPVDGRLNVRSVPITLTARAYLPGPVAPFLAAGAGWYHIIYDYSEDLEALGADDSSESTFGWHVGAGARVMVAPRVSIYGEGRAVFVDPDRNLDDSDFDNIADFDYDSTYFAAGLNLHF